MVRIGSKNPPPMTSTRPDSTRAAQAGDVFGVLVDQPFQERPGRVQGEGYVGIVFENVQEGAIAGAVGLFEDFVEITHGLVVVERQNQADLRHVEPSRDRNGPHAR